MRHDGFRCGAHSRPAPCLGSAASIPDAKASLWMMGCSPACHPMVWCVFAAIRSIAVLPSRKALLRTSATLRAKVLQIAAKTIQAGGANTTILLRKIARRAFTARRRREWICQRQIAEQSECRDEHYRASEHKRPPRGGASQTGHRFKHEHSLYPGFDYYSAPFGARCI